MSLKEKVFVKVNDFLFEEGIVVGKIIYQGNVTYRVLVNDEIIDATEEQISREKDFEYNNNSDKDTGCKRCN